MHIFIVFVVKCTSIQTGYGGECFLDAKSYSSNLVFVDLRLAGNCQVISDNQVITILPLLFLHKQQHERK